MSNRLKEETSPYLLQHAENPVDWYPWCKEAFDRAEDEDKPVFLSIGYSTCHWCHVMAHESFEDEEIAQMLNHHFICVKVDKEERPDLDSIYMTVCQAFTGSGGWPMSLFLTPDKKPFFAGTYFPKSGKGRMIGMRELLTVVHQKWETDRESLLSQAEDIVSSLKNEKRPAEKADEDILGSAVTLFKHIYDKVNSGFGKAPKFPTPHNLLFLMTYYERSGDAQCLKMAERTLTQMYRGGLFDHIGYGFCRYSTDSLFLVPHFEKMLYDNALLIIAYCKAYSATKKMLYLEIAEKTAAYILREMTNPSGGFYSAQDADSDGEEGKYYTFTQDELISLLGEETGRKFCEHFDISKKGNFEGKSIPNLLQSDVSDKTFDIFLPRLYEYRKNRCSLHLDDKVLTSWNSLMIAALCELYRISGNITYLTAAKNADRFIQKYLCDEDTLFVSYKDGKRGVRGFLDDYAAYIFAQFSLYGATLKSEYLEQSKYLCKKAISDFGDSSNGGFYLYSKKSESLILRPKETYDGAIPSGNSLMAWNLVRLSMLSSDKFFEDNAVKQLDFIFSDAQQYPAGYGMFLSAYLDFYNPPSKVTVVSDGHYNTESLPLELSSDTAVLFLEKPDLNYPLKNGKTTYYVCKNRTCFQAVNNLKELK